MKKFLMSFVCILLVVAMAMPVMVMADDEDDLEDLIGLAILGSMLEEAENSGNRTSKKKSPSVPASTAPVTPVSPYMANVHTNGGELNVRSKASKSGRVLTKLYNGASLTVVGQTGSWYQVNANGVTGFVPTRYVQGTPQAYTQTYVQQPVVQQSVVQTGAASGYYAIVNPTNNFVYMRSAPNKSAQPVGVYYLGYRLRILQDLGEWLQVMDESTGSTGYMVKNLVQITTAGAGGLNG